MSKKRGNSEGSIYQRKDLIWVAAISTSTGRKIRYAKTRQLAAQKLLELQQLAAAGLPEARKDITVEALCKEWLAHKKPAWRPKSYELAESIVRLHIVPVLGDVKLAALDIRRASSFVNGLGDTRTGLLSRAHLSAACDMAVRWEWIPRNPVKFTDAPTYRPGRAAEVDSALVLAYLTTMEPTPAYPLLAVLVGCGLRISEALGLVWGDWSQEKGTLTIRRQLGRTEGGAGEFVLADLKTRASRRVVSLPGFVATALQRQQARQEGFRAHVKEGNAEKWGNEWGLIFTSSLGTPLIYTDLRRVVANHARAQGVEPIKFHDLRHAYASLLIDARLPIPVISASMGHANPQITMSTYAHKLKGSENQTADAMQAVWEKREK